MKLLMIIYGGSSPARISALLDRFEVGGYTTLAPAHGAGRSGRREGTRAWPGDADVIFSIVPDHCVAPIGAALDEERTRLATGERLHVAVMPVDQFV